MEIKASSGQIKSEAALLAETLGRIPGSVEELRTAMMALAGCWEGPAWTEFCNAVESDIKEMSRLHGDLVQYARMTDKAGTVYLRTEGGIRDRIRLLF